jgi:hypothetical protein
MILSEADLEHWRTQGFVVARQVISPDQAARTADEIWEFAGRQAHANLKWHIPSRERQDSWYEKTADSRRGHVEMYHGKNQWANRTAPGVHEAFSQIHGTQRVTCSVDRACINPPSRNPDERLESLHWDRAQLYACNIEAHGQHVKAQPGHTNLWDVICAHAPDFPVSVEKSCSDNHDCQGVLYLTDVAADTAPFTIVPGFQHRIKAWLQSLPPETVPSKEDLLALGAIPVPGCAGDLVRYATTRPLFLLAAHITTELSTYNNFVVLAR